MRLLGIVPLALIAWSAAFAQSGALRARTGEEWLELPLLETEIVVEVVGPLVRGRVVQRFSNPTDATLEAVYTFPLPERAAVDSMELRVGARRIVGVVKEREEASRVYTEAREQGRKATLVEQDRPNLFTTRVAAVGPGEQIEVRLGFLEQARWQDGRFELALPLTLTPRCPARTSGPERSGEPGAAAAAPTVSLEVRFVAGAAIEDLRSSSHALDLRWDGDVLVARPAEPLVADRDVVLAWTTTADEPAAQLFVEERDDARYGLLVLTPPSSGRVAAHGLPTRTVFVLDVSGSMEGPPLEQARRALLQALDRLRGDDRFTIVRFDDTAEAWSRALVEAADGEVARARAWIEESAGGGGTDIEGALREAMALVHDDAGRESARIVLVTDGAVDDEDEVFAQISRGLGAARLHVLGIGSAPNRHLIRKAASFGRGVATFVDAVEDVGSRMDEFLGSLERPVLSDLRIAWGAVEPLEIFPRRLPDLHAGLPLTVAVRLPLEGGHPTPVLHARDGATAVALAAGPPVLVAAQLGLASHWARSKVEELMDSVAGGADVETVRRQVVALGIAHALVTSWTSMVAVEDVPTADAASRRVAIANAVPFGTGGFLPTGGTDAPLRLRMGLLLAAAGLLGALAIRRGLA